MILDNDGNVGIGTTDPQECLHLDGAVRGDQEGALRISAGVGYVDIGPKNAEWSQFVTDRASYYFNKEIRVDSGLIGSFNENLSLRTSGTTRLTILNSNGNVGTGMTDPGSSKLRVSNSASDFIDVRFADSGMG